MCLRFVKWGALFAWAISRPAARSLKNRETAAVGTLDMDCNVHLYRTLDKYP